MTQRQEPLTLERALSGFLQHDQKRGGARGAGASDINQGLVHDSPAPTSRGTGGTPAPLPAERPQSPQAQGRINNFQPTENKHMPPRPHCPQEKTTPCVLAFIEGLEERWAIMCQAPEYPDDAHALVAALEDVREQHQEDNP